MRALIVAACLGLSLAGPAMAEEAKKNETPSPYRVLVEDAAIPFASQVRGFRVGEDGSLLLDAGRKWYRAELWPPCQRDLPWEHEIALVDRASRFDRFSSVVIDGEVCRVSRLDEIADPDAKPEGEAKPPAA